MCWVGCRKAQRRRCCQCWRASHEPPLVCRTGLTTCGRPPVSVQCTLEGTLCMLVGRVSAVVVAVWVVGR